MWKRLSSLLRSEICGQKGRERRAEQPSSTLSTSSRGHYGDEEEGWPAGCVLRAGHLSVLPPPLPADLAATSKALVSSALRARMEDRFILPKEKNGSVRGQTKKETLIVATKQRFALSLFPRPFIVCG